MLVQDPKTKKWNRQGVVVEQLPYRQYRIKMLGSGHVTLRNRRFIKLVSVISPPQQIPTATPTDKILLEVQYDFEDKSDPDKPAHHQNTVAETERSDEIVSDLPPRKLPRSLRCLQTYNSPGLKE